MRTSIFIFLCFLLLIVLKLIPFGVSSGDVTIIYTDGLLPSLLNFAIICLSILAVAMLFSIYQRKQKMPGQIMVVQKDIRISGLVRILLYWLGFALVVQLLADRGLYILKTIPVYLATILLAIFIYKCCCKWYVQETKPAGISSDADALFFKSSFHMNSRKISNIKSVGYDYKENKLTLQFPEGLENIDLNLDEYEPAGIQCLLDKIVLLNGTGILFNEPFKQYFPGKVTA